MGAFFTIHYHQLTMDGDSGSGVVNVWFIFLSLLLAATTGDTSTFEMFSTSLRSRLLET